jgi:hypothetical protein
MGSTSKSPIDERGGYFSYSPVSGSLVCAGGLDAVGAVGTICGISGTARAEKAGSGCVDAGAGTCRRGPCAGVWGFPPRDAGGSTFGALYPVSAVAPLALPAGALASADEASSREPDADGAAGGTTSVGSGGGTALGVGATTAAAEGAGYSADQTGFGRTK